LRATVIPRGTIRTIMAGPCNTSALSYTNPNSPFNCLTTPFIDSLNQAWQPTFGNLSGQTLSCAHGIPPFPNLPDIQLYEEPTSNGFGDLRFLFSVPNGAYIITGKFANSCSYDDTVGSQFMSLETQGLIVWPHIDVVAAAGGAYRPVDFVLLATVTNGQLSFIVRFEKASSAGTTISALQIIQTSATPAPGGIIRLLMADRNPPVVLLPQ
jgi:hypothetical protein